MSRKERAARFCTRVVNADRSLGTKTKLWAANTPSSPPRLLVGSWGVDTAGLVWWNWFDKRETITSANKNTIQTAHTRTETLLFLDLSPWCSAYPPQTHKQGRNLTYDCDFLTKQLLGWFFSIFRAYFSPRTWYLNNRWTKWMHLHSIILNSV